MLKSATRLVTQRRKKASPSNLTFASRAASPGPWRVIHHDSGLEHAHQDDDQGRQHDETAMSSLSAAASPMHPTLRGSPEIVGSC